MASSKSKNQMPVYPKRKKTGHPAMRRTRIPVARHLKTTDDLFDRRSSPRTESPVAGAVQWAERIMRKIDCLILK